MDSLLKPLGLLLALVGVIVLVWGLARRAGAPGEAAPRDAAYIAGGSALALVGLGLRTLGS